MANYTEKIQGFRKYASKKLTTAQIKSGRIRYAILTCILIMWTASANSGLHEAKIRITDEPQKTMLIKLMERINAESWADRANTRKDRKGGLNAFEYAENSLRRLIHEHKYPHEYPDVTFK